MSEEEKKIKLEELPDEGSEPVPLKTPRKKEKKKPEPRVEKLKPLDRNAKVELLQSKWIFDNPVRSYYWLVYIFVLCVLEFSPLKYGLRKEIEFFYFIGLGDSLGFLLQHPLVLIVLAPIFYRPPVSSEYHFVVTFDGLETIREFFPYGSKNITTRVRLKWDEIHRVEKIRIENKEILRLFSTDGSHIADLIWYINEAKKKAFYLLLRGMIVPAHPLRIFLDNEKDLK